MTQVIMVIVKLVVHQKWIGQGRLIDVGGDRRMEQGAAGLIRDEVEALGYQGLDNQEGEVCCRCNELDRCGVSGLKQ